LVVSVGGGVAGDDGVAARKARWTWGFSPGYLAWKRIKEKRGSM
jgi:hypothetical protein